MNAKTGVGNVPVWPLAGIPFVARLHRLAALSSDHLFGGAAERAFTDLSFKAAGASQFAGLVIGMLAHREAQALSDAVIANRTGGQTLDQ